jgi:hypothetical protein
LRRRTTALFAVASIVALAACSAIIGTRDDLTLVAADGGGSGEDGSFVGSSSGASSSGASSGATSSGGTSSGGSSGGASSGSSSGPQDSGGDATCSPADLLNDQHNCGTCGHDCGQGACTAGVCGAWTIVPGQFGANEIAVDSTGVYWATETAAQVMRCAPDGTALTTLHTDPNQTPQSVVLDDTSFYWVDETQDTGSIQTCPKTGCPDAGPRLVTEANLSYPFFMQVDSQHVFWADSFLGFARANKLDGGGLRYIVTNPNQPESLTLDDASVFFGTDDTVGRVAKTAAGTPDASADAGAYATIFTANQIVVTGIAVDATNVYWTQDGDPGTVNYAAKDGTGSIHTLAQGEHDPFEITVDANNVYWTAHGPDTSVSGATYAQWLSGYVAMCPKTGCPASGPIQLATGLHNPRGIATDATAIYFTIFGNRTDTNPSPVEGSVLKIMK